MERNLCRKNTDVWRKDAQKDKTKGKAAIAVDKGEKSQNEDSVIRLSSKRLEEAIPRLFQNKIVVAFAGEYTKG